MSENTANILKFAATMTLFYLAIREMEWKEKDDKGDTIYRRESFLGRGVRLAKRKLT